MDKRLFECISCGHYTMFAVSERPRCAKCGGMTGIVDHDSETPRFRASKITLPLFDQDDQRRDH